MSNFAHVKRLRKQLIKLWEGSLKDTPDGKIPAWTADEERSIKSAIRLLRTFIDEARSEDPPPAPQINIDLGVVNPEQIREALAKAKSKKQGK